jgi:acid phosphatase type 7
VSSRIWRRLASRMRPVLTDYRIAEEINMETPSVPGRAGYYSYDFAGWHLIALNGDCSAVGGCGPGSPQERWLADDLRRSPAKCTLAYWNKPRFSSGGTGGDSAYDAFWRRLYSAGAELVLSAGEGHGYERFARQSPDATLDLRRGLRQFVVGTGAAPAMSFRATPSPHSVVRNGDTPGVLQLILEPESYRWHFVPIFGHRFRDAGAGTCRP